MNRPIYFSHKRSGTSPEDHICEPDYTFIMKTHWVGGGGIAYSTIAINVVTAVAEVFILFRSLHVTPQSQLTIKQDINWKRWCRLYRLDVVSKYVCKWYLLPDRFHFISDGNICSHVTFDRIAVRFWNCMRYVCYSLPVS